MEQAETYSLWMGTEVVCRILGIDPARMLAAAGMPALATQRGELRVTARQYFDAWNTIASLTDDPDYIGRLGVAIARGPLIPAFFALSCAPDLETGSRRLSHFKALIGPSRMRVFRNRAGLRIEYASADPHEELPPSLGALHLVHAVDSARNATAYPMQPVAGTLKAPAKDWQEIARFLGLMPEYGEFASLTWANTDARRPFVSENAALWADFEIELRQQLAVRSHGVAMRVRVRSALTELLPLGRSSVEDVCREIGISRSTLQRRLKAEGADFQSLLDDLRLEIATRYLVKSTLRTDEIAFHVGYRDPNSFSRSFRRWTGMSPTDYRARHGTIR